MEVIAVPQSQLIEVLPKFVKGRCLLLTGQKNGCESFWNVATSSNFPCENVFQFIDIAKCADCPVFREHNQL